MPRYNPNVIEPKWQQFWDENQTFRTPELPAGEKLYALDMFPYPSGDGLHVGHPEGYTATDIVCRFARMRGKSVLHPMGFDAFGLPAEEHAIKTGEHPRVQTEKNIETFRRQLKSLGFSYDWQRELATTDVDYFRWTQFIFLVLFDTWFDEQQQQGRPIAELPIPADVQAAGEDAVRQYQDEHRLAFQSDALVNWCPALGTVLANEEVIDGKSDRGNHPVVRMPLRQWMLRITAYADRLENDLESLDWSPGIKTLQRNWIGRSTGAEVDFYIGNAIAGGQRPAPSNEDFATWKTSRSESGYPRKPSDEVLRIYTTRPDTLFGATYMVIAPEHPFVDRLTTDEQSQTVKAYCEQAAHKSDRERQEEGKSKTGVFTGSHAINPVNGEAIPIWIADYVLISYGTGAIMAVPAHDERDFEFAQQFGIDVRCVVSPSSMSGGGSRPAMDATGKFTGESTDEAFQAWHEWRESVLSGATVFTAQVNEGQTVSIEFNGVKFDTIGASVAINSGQYDDLATVQVKKRITTDLASAGLGREAVNYKLRDWLFSRQRFWGEPFPILHEVDAHGQPTGAVRAVDPEDLPVDLPHLEDFKPHGKPEPPLGKAPDEWLYVEKDGKRYRRETNTMPQWAGSCWYYLRFIDPKNSDALVDPAKEKPWMPIDLYVGGAEHAVLHLLYARFWHKVLYDRGYVSTPEPFQRLVNQGMILGEVELTGYIDPEDGDSWISAEYVSVNKEGDPVDQRTARQVIPVQVPFDDATQEGNEFLHTSDGSVKLVHRAHKMSKSRGNVVNPDHIVEDYGADSLRLYEMFMGPLEATKPWSMAGVSGVRNFLDRAWRMIIDDREEAIVLNAAVQEVEPTDEQNRVLHKTIGAVTRDLESMSFNTGIARLMEFTNFFTREEVRPASAMRQFVLLLSPYAPHIGEELWRALGGTDTLAYEPWPAFDPELAKDDLVEIPVQFKGKLKAKIQVPPDISQDELEQAALNDSKVQQLLEGKQIIKTIVVPGRLVNFVVK